MENWVEVFEGYKVSNLGNIYSIKTKKFLKTAKKDKNLTI